MSVSDLQLQLDTLREQLEQNPQLTVEERSNLTDVMEQIQAQIELETVSQDPSISDGVNLAVERFEVDHPTIAGTLRNVLVTLGSMGIRRLACLALNDTFLPEPACWRRPHTCRSRLLGECGGPAPAQRLGDWVRQQAGSYKLFIRSLSAVPFSSLWTTCPGTFAPVSLLADATSLQELACWRRPHTWRSRLAGECGGPVPAQGLGDWVRQQAGSYKLFIRSLSAVPFSSF
jgi:hypothetical protein